MTGLDLESFLQLLRADVGAWASLGLVAVVLGLMTWTSWGSRRALRKCLVLSITAHVGLLLYGSTFPAIAALLREQPDAFDDAPPVRVQLAPTPSGTLADAAEVRGRDGKSSRAVADWDRAGDSAGLADPSIRPITPGEAPKPIDSTRPESAPVAPESVVFEVNPPPPTASAPTPGPATTPSAAPAEPSGVAAAVAAKPIEAANEIPIVDSGRMRPDRVGEVALRPAEIERRPEPPANLVASPTPTIPGVLAGDGSTPRPGVTPSAPPANVAIVDPSDVAAPRSARGSARRPTPPSPPSRTPGPGPAKARVPASRRWRCSTRSGRRR